MGPFNLNLSICHKKNFGDIYLHRHIINSPRPESSKNLSSCVHAQIDVHKLLPGNVKVACIAPKILLYVHKTNHAQQLVIGIIGKLLLDPNLV